MARRGKTVSADDPLRQELGAAGAALPALPSLDTETRARLAIAIREAREHQREALLASAERALQHVPALLRGIVRRMLLG